MSTKGEDSFWPVLGKWLLGILSVVAIGIGSWAIANTSAAASEARTAQTAIAAHEKLLSHAGTSAELAAIRTDLARIEKKLDKLADMHMK